MPDQQKQGTVQPDWSFLLEKGQQTKKASITKSYAPVPKTFEMSPNSKDPVKRKQRPKTKGLTCKPLLGRSNTLPNPKHDCDSPASQKREVRQFSNQHSVFMSFISSCDFCFRCCSFSFTRIEYIWIIGSVFNYPCVAT